MMLWSGISTYLNQLAFLVAPVFYKLVSMSIGASCIGLIGLGLRRVVDYRIPPIWKYLAWLFVVLALVIPYRPQSELAVISHTQPLAELSFRQQYDDIRLSNKIASQEMGDSQTQVTKKEQLNREEKVIFAKSLIVDVVIPIVWLLGMAVMVIFLLISRKRLYREMMFSAKLLDNPQSQKDVDYQRLLTESCQKMKVKKKVDMVIQNSLFSPAIIGLFRPKIILPSYMKDMEEDYIYYILCHELGHFKRKDLLLNHLLLIVQTIYWFNPVIWLLFKRMREDMEVLNDQYVLEHIGQQCHKGYSKALVEVLSCSQKIPIMPKLLCMVDDHQTTKRRIKMIKLSENFKKHRLVIGIIGLAAIILAAMLFLTSKQSEHQVAIYVAKGMNLSREQVETVIRQQQPVLTGADIEAYNPETKMFFLTKKALAGYKEAEATAEPLIIRGGSLILESSGNDSFIITVDGQVACQGHFMGPIFASYVPSGGVLVDTDQGLILDEQRFGKTTGMTESERASFDKVASALRRTDRVFRLPSIDSSATYDTKALWQSRTSYIGDNSAVSRLVSELVLPAGVGYDSIRLETKNHPYQLVIYLKSDAERQAFFAKQSNQAIFLENALILFGLIGNVEQIHFVIDEGSKEPLTLTYTVDQAVDFLGQDYFEKTGQLKDFYWLFYQKKLFDRLVLDDIPGDDKKIGDEGDKSKLAKNGKVKDELVAITTAGIQFYGRLTDRRLTDDEVRAFNRTFDLQPAGAGGTINPISYFLTSFYEKPTEINLGDFLWYYPAVQLSDDNQQDRLEYALLQTLSYFPFELEQKIADNIVPIKRIEGQNVERSFERYMGVSLDQLVNKKESLYLEEYDAFYTYTSDFGLGQFTCRSGMIKGDAIVLDGDGSRLTLKKDKGRYVIFSHTQK